MVCFAVFASRFTGLLSVTLLLNFVAFVVFRANTVKNFYTLTLMSSTFELVQGPLSSPNCTCATPTTSCVSRRCTNGRWHTTQTTDYYEYLVMQFGLNILVVFQALINDMLGDMLNYYISVYLDNACFRTTCTVCQGKQGKFHVTSNRFLVWASWASYPFKV